MRKVISVVVAATAVVLVAAVVTNWVVSTRLAAARPTVPSDSPQWQCVQQWIDSAGPGDRSALRMQVIRPGIILPPDSPTYPPAPEDLHVIVTRHGSEPAQIEVRLGQREWKVSENELDQLPPEVRLHVQRPLGWVLDGPAAAAAFGNLLPEQSQPSDASQERLEKRLDELNTQIEALFKSIESLKE